MFGGCAVFGGSAFLGGTAKGPLDFDWTVRCRIATPVYLRARARTHTHTHTNTHTAHVNVYACMHVCVLAHKQQQSAQTTTKRTSNVGAQTTTNVYTLKHTHTHTHTHDTRAPKFISSLRGTQSIQVLSCVPHMHSNSYPSCVKHKAFKRPSGLYRRKDISRKTLRACLSVEWERVVVK